MLSKLSFYHKDNLFIFMRQDKVKDYEQRGLFWILIFSLNDDRFKVPVAAKKRPLSPINPAMFPVIKLKKSAENRICIKKKHCTFPGRA